MFSAKPRLTHSTPHPNPHRIRSLLARAPEWVNSASREQTAASLAVGSRLREALEHRKSVLLRKNDLFALCRLWRYKSNLWQSRKDRPARAIRGAGAVVLAAAPVPAPQGAPSPLLPAGLSTFPLGAPDSIAAVSREHLALVGTSLTEVRRLTAASVAAFSEPCPSAQCANMQLLPASSLDLITRFMGASDPKLSYAISALSDLSSKLAVAHMNMETRLLQLTPAERKSPAWQVLGAREARDASAVCSVERAQQARERGLVQGRAAGEEQHDRVVRLQSSEPNHDFKRTEKICPESADSRLDQSGFGLASFCGLLLKQKAL